MLCREHSIDVVDNVSIVFGDVVLNVDNDKCLAAHCLLNHKTTGIEITVETAIGGGELQDAVVRVGDAARVVLLVAVAPDLLFRGSVRQYFHRTAQHHALEALSVTEIDTGFGVGLIVDYTQGEGIGGKIEYFNAVADARRQHRLGAGIALLIH